ncbi:MAG: methyltransferase domain-containing protein [Aquabacterium sp.]
MPYCVICQQNVAQWLPYANREQRSPLMVLLDVVGSDPDVYGCPACQCNDRLRHLWLYMAATGLTDQIQGANILHIAPELQLERLIEAHAPAQYIRGDLHPTRAHHQRIDIEAIPVADGSLDLIICNHVLEHVSHPERALQEMHRCLKPGGILIAQTPFAPSLKHTLETHARQDAETNRLLYGQEDHVRLFGSDIVDCFHAAGFSGDLLAHDTLLPDVDPQTVGCNGREPFFVFWRGCVCVIAGIGPSSRCDGRRAGDSFHVLIVEARAHPLCVGRPARHPARFSARPAPA